MKFYEFQLQQAEVLVFNISMCTLLYYIFVSLYSLTMACLNT